LRISLQNTQNAFAEYERYMLFNRQLDHT